MHYVDIRSESVNEKTGSIYKRSNYIYKKITLSGRVLYDKREYTVENYFRVIKRDR